MRSRWLRPGAVASRTFSRRRARTGRTAALAVFAVELCDGPAVSPRTTLAPGDRAEEADRHARLRPRRSRPVAPGRAPAPCSSSGSPVEGPPARPADRVATTSSPGPTVPVACGARWSRVVRAPGSPGADPSSSPVYDRRRDARSRAIPALLRTRLRARDGSRGGLHVDPTLGSTDGRWWPLVAATGAVLSTDHARRSGGTGRRDGLKNR